MKRLKTDKGTQSICNALAYNSRALLVENSRTTRKRITLNNNVIIFESADGNMIISIPNNLIPKYNNNLGKIFAFILSEIPFEANGNPKVSELRIPIKDFTSAGIYTKTGNAKRALTALGHILKHIDVEFTSEKPGEYDYRCDSLFSGFGFMGKDWIVTINKKAPWSLFKNQYINIPEEWFSLSSRTFDLVQNVAMIVRRSATSVSKLGYVDIDLREIAFWLALPSDRDTRNSGKLIKMPIINSVAEANLIRSDFTFELFADEKRPVSDFLDRGYLRIFVNGETKEEVAERLLKRCNEL